MRSVAIHATIGAIHAYGVCNSRNRRFQFTCCGMGNPSPTKGDMPLTGRDMPCGAICLAARYVPNGARYALRRDMLLMERDMSCGRDILPNGKAICLAARYAPYGVRDALTGVKGYGWIRELRKFFENFYSNSLHF